MQVLEYLVLRGRVGDTRALALDREGTLYNVTVTVDELLPPRAD